MWHSLLPLLLVKLRLVSRVPRQSFALLMTMGRPLCERTLLMYPVVLLVQWVMEQPLCGLVMLITRRGTFRTLLVAGVVALTSTLWQTRTEL